MQKIINKILQNTKPIAISRNNIFLFRSTKNFLEEILHLNKGKNSHFFDKSKENSDYNKSFSIVNNDLKNFAIEGISNSPFGIGIHLSQEQFFQSFKDKIMFIASHDEEHYPTFLGPKKFNKELEKIFDRHNYNLSEYFTKPMSDTDALQKIQSIIHSPNSASREILLKVSSDLLNKVNAMPTMIIEENYNNKNDKYQKFCRAVQETDFDIIILNKKDNMFLKLENKHLKDIDFPKNNYTILKEVIKEYVSGKSK